jgi:hypothetical protein
MQKGTVDLGSYEAEWSAREVVREIDHAPHLLLRLTVRGEHFPHRAAVPVMRLIADGKPVDSWFAEIPQEEDGIVGYFAVDAAGDMLEFGYDEGGPLRRLRVSLDKETVERLDRDRLDKEVVETNMKYLQQKLSERRDG